MPFPYKPRNLRYCYNPESKDRFKVSRSKIDLFVECPRCFYLDQRLGFARVKFPPFSLNNAVDGLLKKEFDKHRAKGTWHPVLKENNLRLKPFKHEKMDAWRDAMRQGVQYELPDTNLIIRGGVDDIWVDGDDTLYVADYKATAKESDAEVTLDSGWQIMYKRQAEVYQWLLRKNGFTVSNTAYFYYVNGQLNADGFNGALKFNVKIIPYEGDDGWVEETVYKLFECLVGDDIPDSGQDCEHCGYFEALYGVLHSKYEKGNSRKLKQSAKDEALF